MTRRRAERRRLALVLLASATSTAALSLSRFDPIDSLSVPIGCSFAYDTPLRGCRPRDFADGNTCSVQCRLYLEKAEYNIQAACHNVNAETGTLMYKAQQGQLADELCESDDAETTTKTIVVAPPTTKPTTTARPTFTKATTAETTAETTEEARETTQVTTKEPPPETTSKYVLTTKSKSISTTSESAIETSAEPTTSAELSDTPEATTETTTEATAEATTEASAPSDTAATTGRPRETQDPGSGGGSPADFVSGAAQLPRMVSLCIAAVVGLVIARY